MNKTVSIILTIAIIIAAFIFFTNGSKENKKPVIQNVEIIDNIQYITITAKAGYSPSVTSAKSDIPTKIIIKTNNTYDCSAALVIRSINFQKVLAQTGEEIIDIGIQKNGEKMTGTCSMGMYNFTINFN